MRIKNTREGLFLKAKRIEAGLTQSQLGKKLGVHTQYISNWECGKCPPPSAKYKKLVKLLKINTRDLLFKLESDFYVHALKFVSKLK